jgi:hypothetical protein
LESEKIRDDGYRAADQLSADAITDADAKLRGAGFSSEAKAARDEAYAAASDARAGLVAEAERRHYDRLAAIQRHFSQQVTSHGSADAGHALAFLETVAGTPRGCMRRNPARLLRTEFEAPAGLSRSITTGSSARFASTPMVASSPRALSQTTDGRGAGHSRAPPKPSWRPREPALV